MIEDTRIRDLGFQSQRAQIWAVKDFSGFLGCSLDTAMTEGLCTCQLHTTDTGGTPLVYTARITALRFFFSVTYRREEMKRYMQFRTQLRKLPAELSAEEVSKLLLVALGPGLKYKAAPSIF